MERGTMGRDRPIAKTTAKARKRLVRSGGSVQVLAQAGARRPLGEAGGLQPDSLAGKRPPLAVEGRTMIANEGYGVLSTNSSMYPGYPAAATVALAADAEGRPVFSFSNLSNHAADVARDGRVSLSVVRGNLTAPDEPRVNLVGRIRRLAPEEEDDARELYLQKHPEAWWTRFRMDDIKGARVVAGFGQAGTVPPDEYVNAQPDPISEFSTEIVQQMNSQRGEQVKQLVKHFAGFEAERAEMLFCDQYGMDVRAYVGLTNYKVRVAFKKPVNDRDGVNSSIQTLLDEIG